MYQGNMLKINCMIKKTTTRLLNIGLMFSKIYFPFVSTQYSGFLQSENTINFAPEFFLLILLLEIIEGMSVTTYVFLSYCTYSVVICSINVSSNYLICAESLSFSPFEKSR